MPATVEISHIIERKCQGCEQKFRYETIDPTPEQRDHMTGWFVIVREVYIEGREEFVKFTAQAHSPECIMPAVNKMNAALAKELEHQKQKANEPLDLNSLRVN